MKIFDEKGRAERKERRLMKTSTYDALSERVEPGLVPENAEQMIHEDLLADTIAVERRRWIERGSWIVLALLAACLGYLAGLEMHEKQEPEPWKCVIELGYDAEQPDFLRCSGGTGQILK